MSHHKECSIVCCYPLITLMFAKVSINYLELVRKLHNLKTC